MAAPFASLSPRRLAEMAALKRRYDFLTQPLLDFVPSVSSNFVSPRHLAPLAAVLERAEDEAVRALVSVPPRHGKTETILHAIARYLARNPTRTVGYATYSYNLAKSKSRSARDYARRAGVQIRDDADSLSEWRTTLGGGLLAAGVGGTWTGHGVDVLIVDDPIKNREDAESRVVREKVFDWLTSTALTRVEPGGAVIVNMARWHADDLIGRLARDQAALWEVLNLPALDEEGDALWPEQWSAEALAEKRAEIGEYDFASLYLGSPRVRGTNVFREPARCTAPEINGRRILIGVDVAATVNTRSDYSVAVVLAVTGSGAKMRADIIDVYRDQVEIPRLCIELERLQKKWNAPLVVESVGVGKAVPQLLKQLGGKLRVVEVIPKGDKFLRAQSLAAAWNDGRVRVPATDSPWIRPYLSELLNFTGVRDDHDDAVDATAHAWNHAIATAPVTPVQLNRGPFARSVDTAPTDQFGRRIPS
jgi:predicted phage terminase large subunit-like protein